MTSNIYYRVLISFSLSLLTHSLTMFPACNKDKKKEKKKMGGRFPRRWENAIQVATQAQIAYRRQFYFCSLSTVSFVVEHLNSQLSARLCTAQREQPRRP